MVSVAFLDCCVTQSNVCFFCLWSCDLCWYAMFWMLQFPLTGQVFFLRQLQLLSLSSGCFCLFLYRQKKHTLDCVTQHSRNASRTFSARLVQHVNSETHSNEHTLDLVITRCDENFLSKLETFNPLLSDHLLIHCHLNFAKQVTKSKLRAFRKMRSFDVDKFCLELSNSELLTSTFMLLLFTSQSLFIHVRLGLPRR